MDIFVNEEKESARIRRLNAFAQSLTKKKDKAVKAREASGIEQIWREDAEFYEGIDNANRHESQTSEFHDPYSTTDSGRSTKAMGSTIFLNITRPYCDMAAASMADMLTPNNQPAYAIEPTPVPFLIEDSKSTEAIDIQGQPMPLATVATAMLNEAKEKAKKANTQISDWLEEANWQGEVRKLLHDAAKLGTAVIKGPFPQKRTAKRITRENGTVEIIKVIETQPTSKRIAPQNLYPDPDCGEDIHNGSYIWEKDTISWKQLYDLKGTPDFEGNSLYIDSEIDAILAEGPNKAYLDKNFDKSENDIFEIWYYTGIAQADDIRAAGCYCEDDEIQNVMVVMVNNRVIRAGLNPLDSGSFNYDVMVWQRKAGSWCGIGIARQIRAPQRIINAAIRNMMDNAGKGGTPIPVITSDVQVEGGGRMVLSRNTVLRVAPESPYNAVQAVSMLIIPMITNELRVIIQDAMKYAEDVTGMPLLLQGMQGSAPDTVGGMTMLNNNAAAPRRNVARFFDDRIVKPHLEKYYEWLLLYGDDEAKGDFQIIPRGSTVLFERDAQNMAIIQMAAFVKDPAFRIDPAKWIKEYFASLRIDSERLQYSDEEWQAIEQKMQQNPGDPRIQGNLQVASMRQQGEMEKAKLNQASDMAELQIKQTMQDKEMQFKAVQAQQEREHALQVKAMERDIEIMRLANDRNISIDKIKAELAQTSVRLRTQKELAADKDAPQVERTPMEPVGRADNGRAFEQ